MEQRGLPNVIGFPKANLVVGGNTGNQNWVWRVDVDSGTGEKLELPQSEPTGLVKWNSYATSRVPEFSPDGEVFALGRSVTVWDTFDRSRDSEGELPEAINRAARSASYRGNQNRAEEGAGAPGEGVIRHLDSLLRADAGGECEFGEPLRCL